jgi:hypothetical protein
VNIFVLDNDPVIAARYHASSTIPPQCFAIASILSEINEGPYRTARVSHPWVNWTRAGIENYNWLVAHGMALCNEYEVRSGLVHKSKEVIWLLNSPYEKILPDGGTPFIQHMAPIYRDACAITAHRRFYTSKVLDPYWKPREQPKWWLDESVL